MKRLLDGIGILVVGQPGKFVDRPIQSSQMALGASENHNLVVTRWHHIFTICNQFFVKLFSRSESNKFDFDDFLKQIKMIKKMGSLKSLLGMMPGISNQIKNADIDDKQLVRVESIIQSMTHGERHNPKILNGSRRKRIARGSGNSIQDVNRLIKQFNEMQKMMKMFKSKGGKKMMGNMKNLRFN